MPRSQNESNAENVLSSLIQFSSDQLLTAHVNEGSTVKPERAFKRLRTCDWRKMAATADRGIQKNIYLANSEPCVAAEIDAKEDQLGQMMSWSRELLGDSWWAGVEQRIIGNVSSLAVLITFSFLLLLAAIFFKACPTHFPLFSVQYAVAFSSFVESFVSFDQPRAKGPDHCNLNPSQHCQQFFKGASGEFVLLWGKCSVGASGDWWKVSTKCLGSAYESGKFAQNR